MVNYGDLQFAEKIMVARRSEMSTEWKVRFAICIASVAIQAFTKLLFSFSDVLKAFRKPKSLKDILVRADISPRSFYNGQCQKCNSRRCMTCKNIQCTQKFSSTHIGEEFIIYCNANCKMENFICLLESTICGLQYIGETKQQLSKRLNGHRSQRRI